MRITFRRHKRENGLRSVGYPYRSVDIKVDGKRVGTISAPNWRDKGWRVSVAVKKDNTYNDNNSNCGWVWVWLKTLDTEQDARDWVWIYLPEFAAKHTLHAFEA